MYRYNHSGLTWPAPYLWPEVLPLIPPRSRVFELGCGNGNLVAKLRELGHEAVGVDPSESGIAHAGPNCFVGSAYDDLAARYGRFPVVVSLEVVEHLMEPRRFARVVHDLLEPGGLAIISTPYHGYLKNLGLALTGRLEAHLDPLWDGGHVKFWSEPTLRTLLEEVGFADIRFIRVGRIPPLAKSMVAVARRSPG